MTDKNRVRYKNLNEEQKEIICNGCGGKGGKINPPEFRFGASCNQHDFNYWLGCTEEDRKKADKQFYTALKKDVKTYPWYRRPTYYCIAWIFYKAVRIRGKKFFNYSDSYKTKKDLLKEIKKFKDSKI